MIGLAVFLLHSFLCAIIGPGPARARDRFNRRK